MRTIECSGKNTVEDHKERYVWRAYQIYVCSGGEDHFVRDARGMATTGHLPACVLEPGYVIVRRTLSGEAPGPFVLDLSGPGVHEIPEAEKLQKILAECRSWPGVGKILAAHFKCDRFVDWTTRRRETIRRVLGLDRPLTPADKKFIAEFGDRSTGS